MKRTAKRPPAKGSIEWFPIASLLAKQEKNRDSLVEELTDELDIRDDDDRAVVADVLESLEQRGLIGKGDKSQPKIIPYDGILSEFEIGVVHVGPKIANRWMKEGMRIYRLSQAEGDPDGKAFDEISTLNETVFSEAVHGLRVDDDVLSREESLEWLTYLPTNVASELRAAIDKIQRLRPEQFFRPPDHGGVVTGGVSEVRPVAAN